MSLLFFCLPVVSTLSVICNITNPQIPVAGRIHSFIRVDKFLFTKNAFFLYITKPTSQMTIMTTAGLLPSFTPYFARLHYLRLFLKKT